MRPVIACALVFLMLAGPASAQSSPGFSPADRLAIREAIEGQIAAFRRDDGEAAFAFASPAIRKEFRTADNFMTMIRRDYALVYRPGLVAFGDLYDEGAGVIQLVGLVGADGRTVAAAYEMAPQPDGSWKINGCSFRRPEPTS
jgi:hypothetical protein